MNSKVTIAIQVLLGLVQVGNYATSVVPAKWQPVVAGVTALLQIIQARLAHSYNPDGTPAAKAYVKPAAALLLTLLIPGLLMAQANPPVQHFVMSTMGGSFGGDAVSIAATGIQLVQQPSYAVSAAYEFISNPADSSKPRVGSGIVNVTKPLSSFLPSVLKSKLLIDTTNYNVTFQGGAGRESVSNGVGVARTNHTIGNFGVFGSYPLPGGHVQFGIGYKWITGAQGGLIHVPAGQLNFTF